MPVKDWANDLDGKGKAQLLAAAYVMENALRDRRPPAGRAEKVKGSKEGLWELKVTKPGSTPPHLRVLYVRDGNTLWAAIGFTKTSNKLKQQDIDVADTIVREWKGAKP